MNTVIEFLTEQWPALAAALGAGYGMVQGFVSYYRKHKNKVFEEIDRLVNQVEHPGDGREKMSAVVDKLFDKVPAVFNKMLTKKRIRLWVQSAWKNMQEYSDKQDV